jgi:hypothetical protein
VIGLRERSRTVRIVTEVPAQRPEGALIEQVREARAPRLSIRAAAIVSGYQSAGAGQYITVVGPAETIARMAKVVGVTAEQLMEAGREDAAAELMRLHRIARTHPVGTGTDPLDLTGLSDEQIELVKAVIREMRSQREE